MLISRTVQPDAQSTEFARRHAASRPTAADHHGGFADYLASTLYPARHASPEGAIRRPDSSAQATRTDADNRMRDSGAVSRDDARAHDASAVETQDESNATSESREQAAAARDERPHGDERGLGKVGTGEESADLRSTNSGKPGKTGPPERPTGEQSGGKISADAPATKQAGESGATRPTARKRVAAEGAEDAEPAASPNGLKARRVSENTFEIDVAVDLEAAASGTGDRRGDVKELAAGRATGRGDAATDGRARDEAARKAAARRPATQATVDAGTAHETRAGARRASGRPGGRDVTQESEETRAANRVEVRDVRASRRGGQERSGGDEHAGREGSGPGGSAEPARPELVRESGPGSGGNAFESARGEAQFASPAAKGSESPLRAAANQAATLRQALQDQVNGEIVRSARLIVRGSDSGEIRLNLKPEHLGTVRISLQMQDGHIAGRIIVDNQSVREVFEQNLASLQRAFQESGLEAGGVEISLADSGTQGRDEDGRTARRATVRDAADRFGLSVPELNRIDDYHDLIDVTV